MASPLLRLDLDTLERAIDENMNRLFFGGAKLASALGQLGSEYLEGAKDTAVATGRIIDKGIKGKPVAPEQAAFLMTQLMGAGLLGSTPSMTAIGSGAARKRLMRQGAQGLKQFGGDKGTRLPRFARDQVAEMLKKATPEERRLLQRQLSGVRFNRAQRKDLKKRMNQGLREVPEELAGVVRELKIDKSPIRAGQYRSRSKTIELNPRGLDARAVPGIKTPQVGKDVVTGDEFQATLFEEFGHAKQFNPKGDSLEELRSLFLREQSSYTPYLEQGIEIQGGQFGTLMKRALREKLADLKLGVKDKSNRFGKLFERTSKDAFKQVIENDPVDLQTLRENFHALARMRKKANPRDPGVVESKARFVSPRTKALKQLETVKYPFDAQFDGETVSVLGPVELFPPYSKQAGSKIDYNQLMIRKASGERVSTFGSGLKIEGKALVPRSGVQGPVKETSLERLIRLSQEMAEK